MKLTGWYSTAMWTAVGMSTLDALNDENGVFFDLRWLKLVVALRVTGRISVEPLSPHRSLAGRMSANLVLCPCVSA